jgi:SAM-dependent methyltransferase
MRPVEIREDLLHTFLNVMWLRPEAALFLAISAHVLRQAPYQPTDKPSLDIGGGHGLFLFFALGGALQEEYDVYRHVQGMDSFWQKRDIYDGFAQGANAPIIERRPSHTITYTLDHKKNLLRQAQSLGLYENHLVSDANQQWPFGASQLQSVFSNIFYWLDNPVFLFKEVSRVLTTGGRAFLALQDPMFLQYCPSYRARDYPRYQEILQLLNRGRGDNSLWRLDFTELKGLAQKNGLRLIYRRSYLTEMVLRVWDIGLRPFSPVLIQMANALNPIERQRCKKEWVEICSKLLLPLFESEKNENSGGYQYLIFEKNGSK